MKTSKLKNLLSLLLVTMLCFSIKAQDDVLKMTLITNVDVWVGDSEKVISADVLIENNLIKQVKKGITAPAGATVIDGKGGTIHSRLDRYAYTYHAEWP